MTTDFTYGNKAITTSGPTKPATVDSPNDLRTRVKTFADIRVIPMPYVGMTVTVLADETNNGKMTDYKVKSLKANSLGIANSLIDEVVRYVDYLGVSSSGGGTSSGTGTGLTSEQAQQLQTAYEHSQSDHVQPNDLLNIDAVSLNGKKISNPMTKAEYDAIADKDPNTIYLVDDDTTITGVPDYSISDANKVLAVNSNGTALAWIDAPSGSGNGLTTEQISQLTTAYEHSKTTHVQSSDITKLNTDIQELDSKINNYASANFSGESTIKLGTNILNLDTLTEGYVVKNDGSLEASSSYSLTDYIAVPAGVIITGVDSTGINGCFYNTNKEFIRYIAASDYIKTEEPRQLQIPDGVAYFRMNMVGGISENKNKKKMYILGQEYPFRYVPYGMYLDYYKYDYNRFFNLKMNILGDSITAASRNGYGEYIAKTRYLNTYRNYGIAGTTVTGTPGAAGDNSMSTRVSNMDPDADIIGFMGGTNDAASNKTLGNIDSTGTTTFYGALKYIAETLLTKYPLKTIFFMTPPRLGGASLNTSKTLEDGGYVNAIIEVAALYAIPCIDVYHNSGFNPEIEALTNILTVDGCHPTPEYGTPLLARYISGEIEKLLPLQYEDKINVSATVIDLESISLSPSSTTVTAGQTQQIEVVYTPSNATNKNINWESNNTTVAEITANGVINAKQSGNCTITAISQANNSITATCLVTVTGGTVVTPTLSSISATFNQGSTKVYPSTSLDSLKTNLTVTAIYSDNSQTTVSSSDYTLNGTLIVGTSTITVSYSGKNTTFNVNVTAEQTTPDLSEEGIVTDRLTFYADARNNVGSGENKIPEKINNATIKFGKFENVVFGENGATLNGSNIESSGGALYNALPNYQNGFTVEISMHNFIQNSVLFNCMNGLIFNNEGIHLSYINTSSSNKTMKIASYTNLVDNGANKTFSSLIDVSQQVHIIYRYNGNGTVNAWINGYKVADSAITNAIDFQELSSGAFAGNVAFRINHGNTNSTTFQFLRLYDKALSDSEIEQNFSVD